VTFAPPSIPLLISWAGTLAVVLYLLAPVVSSPPAAASAAPSDLVKSMRALFVVVIFGAEIAEIMQPVKIENTHYMAGSRLKEAAVDTSGIKNLAFFTHWAWCSLGLYFFATLLPDLCQLAGVALPLSPLVEPMLFTVCAPNALLVSVIVSFVLWPGLLKDNNDTSGMRATTVLLMHNFNSFAVVCEMVVAGTRLHPNLIAVAPLYGLLYVLFAWVWSHRCQPKDGVQYFYDFLDTTLPPGFQCGAFFGLLAVLLVFYGVATVAGQGLDKAEGMGYESAAGAGLLVAVSFICKLRD
jgi:hypothetical protein